MTELRDEAFQVADVERTTVFDGRVWDVVSETFSYGDETLTREFVAHPGAAAVVAIDEHDRVLVLQQYRHPIGERDWEIPAGLLDIPGEDPAEAAARELAEEADLQAQQLTHLVSFHTTPGGNSEIIHCYLAQGLSPVTTDFVREGEDSDMRIEWLPIGEVVDAILSGRFRNGTLMTGVLAAAERLRRERA